jgi:hypothetical protein
MISESWIRMDVWQIGRGRATNWTVSWRDWEQPREISMLPFCCLLGLLYGYENGGITFLRNVYRIVPVSMASQFNHRDQTQFPVSEECWRHGDVPFTRRTVITFVCCSKVNRHVMSVVLMSVISLIHLLAAFFFFYYPTPHFLYFSLETPCSSSLGSWYSSPGGGAAPSWLLASFTDCTPPE